MGPANKMTYFNNVTSLVTLKNQYRQLALANHPDRGGSTQTMQEINAEYFKLFPIWKNISNDVSNDTATSTQREFYTANGWEGENYNTHLRVADIAKIVRSFVKEKYPTYKFSVTTRDASCIYISLMEAPMEVFVTKNMRGYDLESSYIQVNHYQISKDERMTELCREILADVAQFAQTYNFDDSDCQIDYFHTNFYLYVNVGKWNKPFKVVPRQARVKAEKATNVEVVENEDVSTNVLGQSNLSDVKVTDLIVGQKYIWRRNSEATHQVEYVGTDYCGSVLVYVFKYVHNGELKYTELPIVHCERDVKRRVVINHVRNYSLYQELAQDNGVVLLWDDRYKVFFENDKYNEEWTIAIVDLTNGGKSKLSYENWGKFSVKSLVVLKFTNIEVQKEYGSNGRMSYYERKAYISENLFKSGKYPNARITPDGLYFIRLGLNIKLNSSGVPIWRLRYDDFGNIIKAS